MLPQIGSPVSFFDDFYKDGYIPQVLDLVLEAWDRVVVSDVKHEPRISRLLSHHMGIILYERRNQRPRLPLLIEPEAQKLNPDTGKEDFRWDIELHSREPRHPDARAYFVFEAKKLRVTVNSPNNGQYLNEMLTFLADTKRVAPAHVGMLGYVMDGEVNVACEDIHSAMKKKSELNIVSSPLLRSSGHLPHPPHGETEHHSATNRQRNLVIYHLLLPANASSVGASIP